MSTGFRGVMRSAVRRVQDDGKEILSSFSKWRIAKKEKKPVNVWVAAFWFIVGIPAAYLVFWMTGGVIQIVFTPGSPNAVPAVSQEALTGLILVATGLGALMLWFAGVSDRSGKKRVKVVGKGFLLAALTLSIFMFLSPSLPYVSEAPSSHATFIAVVTVSSLLFGSFSFIWAALLGLFYMWKL